MGSCETCKFKKKLFGTHWGRRFNYQYECKRFPPPAPTYDRPYENQRLVLDNDYCGEYKNA